MTRIWMSVGLVALLAISGCKKSDHLASGPADPKQTVAAKGKETTPPSEALTEPAKEAKEAAVAPDLPTYTEEQQAAARQLASDLGVVIKDDNDGNVISIDTAVGRSWADDYQMQEILVFPTLTSLTVEGPSISDALAPRIAEQRNLISLAMRNTLIGDDGIAGLGDLKNLKVIEMRAAPLVSDKAMEALAQMPSLRAVRLVGSNISDTGIETLLQLPALSELDVRGCRNVSKTGLENFRDKTSLRVLKIGSTKIDDEVLALVAEMTNITSLALDTCNITDAGVTKLDKLPLTSFTVFQCSDVNDKGLKVLANYPDLSQLTLRDVPAKCACLALLPHPERITSLTLGQSNISDSEAAVLSKMTSLQKLDLSITGVTDGVVETLGQLKKLKQLTISETGISEEGVHKLKAALPDCAIRY
jgi:Leucine-rich repeat (LRR) protein